MKIEKIEIKGLFGKKDICWELNPQVNVLVGVNGSGKSTILSIIYSFLIRQVPKNWLNELIHSAKLDFEIGYAEFKTQDDEFKEKILESLHKDNNLKELIEALSQGGLLRFGTYSEQEKSNAILNIKQYVDLIESSTNHLHASQKIDFRTRSETNALDLEIRDTIHGLNKLSNPELMNQLTGSLNVFFNQIGKHVSYENNELVYTDTQLQQKLNYSHLSSGERQLIYILLRVALSNGDKSKTAIILMDEPEISLHLDWQEHFIKQLTILNPDAQFIIVTHSPALIMNGWNDVYVDMEEITTWQ